MPLTISTDAISEKNKLASSSPWLLLLEIIYPGEPSIRVVWNTSDITWDGETWLACPFKLDDLEESKESNVPSVNLSIVDIERRITPYLDQYSGGVGATVYIRVVHADYLDSTNPELEERMEIIDVAIDHMNAIKFTLGAENLSNYRSPRDRFLKGHCRYQEFKGSLCGYSGSDTECSRTYEDCCSKGNQARFGGFPGLVGRGYYR